MEDQIRINEAKIKQLQQQLKQEQKLLDEQSQRIESKFGIDYLNFLQGNPVEKRVEVVRVVHRIFSQEGDLLTNLTEEYIEKRDGTRALFRIVG